MSIRTSENWIRSCEVATVDLEVWGRRESEVAHIGRGDGSWICLCGYVGVRRATPEEARKAGYCAVCFEMYYGFLPELRT
jgi:hypothetical protein